MDLLAVKSCLWPALTIKHRNKLNCETVRNPDLLKGKKTTQLNSPNQTKIKQRDVPIWLKEQESIGPRARLLFLGKGTTEQVLLFICGI